MDSIISGVTGLFGGDDSGGFSSPSGQTGDVDSGYYDYDFSPSTGGGSSGSSGGSSFDWGGLGSGLLKTAGSSLPLLALLGSGSGSRGTGTMGTTATTQTPYFQSQTQTNNNIASAGAARSAAYEDLARQLSVRGIGPNSPYSAGKATGIQRQYLNSLASINNKATTPIGYNTSSTTNTESSGSNRNQLAYALALMQSMNGGKNSNNLFSLFG